MDKTWEPLVLWAENRRDMWNKVTALGSASGVPKSIRITAAGAVVAAGPEDLDQCVIDRVAHGWQISVYRAGLLVGGVVCGPKGGITGVAHVENR